MEAPNVANNNLQQEIDMQEIIKMVQSFRNQELRLLLIFADLSPNGRKPDLMQRALILVKTTKYPQIIEKVKNLYRQIYGRSSDSNYAEVPPPSLVPSSSQYGIYAGMSTSDSSLGNNMVGTSTTTNPLTQSAARQNIELCPRWVKLTHLPFYDVLADIVPPSTLVPMMMGKFQDKHLTFSVSPNQMEMLLQSQRRTLLPRVELQLRFCLYSPDGDQKDDFPTGCILRMNDRVVQIPNVIPTNKVGVEAKRPSRPVDLTSHVVQGRGDQRIHISWQHDGVRHWTVSVYVVRHLTAEILLRRVQAKHERPNEQSINMIKEILGVDGPDSDIAATSLRVSLLCPLGKIRMVRPCRLRACRHLQCFDLDLFLQMNEKRPTWTCPVCDAPIVPFSDLQIDGYFTHLLKQTKDDVHEVELYEGGGFSSIADESAKSDEVKKPPNVSAVEDRKEATTSHFVSEILSAPASPDAVGRPNRPRSSDDCEIIDLCSDDDDEDDRINNRAESSCTSNVNVIGTESLCSSRSSPSIIILDSPSPQTRSTPEDPKNADDEIFNYETMFNKKRSADQQGQSSPNKRFKEADDSGPSTSTSTDFAWTTADLLKGFGLASNGESNSGLSNYAIIMKHIMEGMAGDKPGPSYNNVPPPPSTPPPPSSSSQPVNRSGNFSGTSSATSVGNYNVTSSAPAGTSQHLDNLMNEEFQAFLKTCLPSTQ